MISYFLFLCSDQPAKVHFFINHQPLYLPWITFLTTTIHTCKQSLPNWKHNRKNTICSFAPTGKEQRGQRRTDTLIIGGVHESCVLCVFLLTHSTFSLPEGGGGREDNLAFIKALSYDLTTSFKLPWKQSIPTKWCMITITGHNLGQNLVHLCRREIRPGMCSCGCLIWQQSLAPLGLPRKSVIS